MLNRLYDILERKRPEGGDGIKYIVNRYIKPIARPYHDPYKRCLAWVISVGELPILFSAHLDTVHMMDGKQRIIEENGRIKCREPGILGADDGAGVWLLLEMIEANVPATFIFHHGEEIGGIGSAGMADYHPLFLEQFVAAIAFDRRGTGDVITHQRGLRCCSDVFAEALSEELSDDDYFYLPERGIFTDTANYDHIINECTNVSVGYANEHTSMESLDLPYLLSLRERVIRLDWGRLPIMRDPNARLDSLYEEESLLSKLRAFWEKYHDDFRIE